MALIAVAHSSEKIVVVLEIPNGLFVATFGGRIATPLDATLREGRHAGAVGSYHDGSGSDSDSESGGCSDSDSVGVYVFLGLKCKASQAQANCGADLADLTGGRADAAAYNRLLVNALHQSSQSWGSAGEGCQGFLDPTEHLLTSFHTILIVCIVVSSPLIP